MLNTMKTLLYGNIRSFARKPMYTVILCLSQCAHRDGLKPLTQARRRVKPEAEGLYLLQTDSAKRACITSGIVELVLYHGMLVSYNRFLWCGYFVMVSIGITLHVLLDMV